MSSMSKQKKINILSAGVAVVLILTALVCWAAFRPQALEGVKNITVTVMHANGDILTEKIDTTAKYLGDALVDHIDVYGEYTEDGELIVYVVDGEYADASRGFCWILNVNGEDTDLTLDVQPVVDDYIYTLYSALR